MKRHGTENGDPRNGRDGQRREEERLKEAVKLVHEAIADERKRLEVISKTEDGDVIMLEDETTAGYFCHMLVDPKDVAKIALEYNYPVWLSLKMATQMVCGRI